MASDPTPEGEPIAESELVRTMIDFYSGAGALSIASTVDERQVARARRLFRLYLRPDLWSNLETALRSVTPLPSAMAESGSVPLQQAAVLAERVAGDVEEAFDGLLVGVAARVSDTMRDVMEAELLIRLFVSDPSLVAEWADADREKLYERFSPGKVRAKVAQAQGLVGGVQLPDAWEYEVHSDVIHASPDPRAAAARRRMSTLDELPHLTQEIVIHAARFLDAVDALFEAVDLRPPPRPIFVPITQLAHDLIPQREPRTRAERRRLEREMRKHNPEPS